MDDSSRRNTSNSIPYKGNIDAIKSIHSIDISAQDDGIKPVKIEDTESTYREESEHKVKKSSFMSCLAIFVQVGLGIGVLAVPHTINKISFVFGIICLVLFAIFNWWSLNMLAYVSSKYKVYEYATLVKTTLGDRFSIVFNLSILFATFCTIIAFIEIRKNQIR